MNTDDKYPQRKTNRLKNYDYRSCGAYFVTICTKSRIPLLWSEGKYDFVGEDTILPPDNVPLSACGKIVDDAIKSISKHYAHVQVLQYVIMPNHIHLILLISCDDGRMISSPTSVLTVVGQLKRHVSIKLGKSIWQRSFYDHVIRDKADHDKLQQYIYENPTKWKYDNLYVKQ